MNGSAAHILTSLAVEDAMVWESFRLSLCKLEENSLC